jgi:hypothetical protein
MLAAYLIIAVAVAVLTWRNVHQGLWVLTALLPSYLLRTEVFGLPTTMLELMIVAFVGAWIIKHKIPPLHKGGLRGVECIALSILLISIVAIFVSPNTTAALGVWKAYFLEPIVLFFIVRYELTRTPTPPSPPSGRGGIALFEALGVCALFLSSIAIIQWFTGKGIPIPWDIERRVTSVFDYPNALGLFLGPIVVIASLMIPPLTKGGAGGVALKRAFWILTSALSFLAIILAQSEAAIVAVIATLSLAGLLNQKTRWTVAVTLSAIIIFVLLCPWRSTVFDKLTLQDYSGQVRLTQWSETVDMLGDHWFWGAGLSGYPTVFAPYHKATHIEIFQYPHNIFLNTWVEIGLMGLIIFFVLVASVLRVVRASTIPAFFALLEIFIHGLVDVPYFKNDLAVLTWLILAIFFAYVSAPQTKTKN